MRSIALLLFVGLLSALLAGCGGGSNNPVLAKTKMAVIGDMPYGLSPMNNGGVANTTQFSALPAFFAAINKDPDVSVVLHVGDIHSGSEPCTEAFDRSIAAQLATLRFPVVYTPGDNEWSDCQKPKQAGGLTDPVANLDLVRSIFFPNAGKAFNGSLDVHSQAIEFDPAFPADKKYIENVWWFQSGVLFVTLNVPGGSNNDNDIWGGATVRTTAQVQEVAERSAANNRWLDVAFRNANSLSALGVVVLVQADMWDMDSKVDATGTVPTLFTGTPTCPTAATTGCSHIYEYKQFIDAIAANARVFVKPVLLFNGDSHFYRSDNPLKVGQACEIETLTINIAAKTAVPNADGSSVACSSSTVPPFINGQPDAYRNQPNGYDVPNFRRVVVHGSTLPFEYLKLTIDPGANVPNGVTAFGPFSWTRVKP